MLIRLLFTFSIIGGLSLLYVGWQKYKQGLIKRMQPAQTPTGKPTLLYFTAAYCAPCKFQQTPIIERLSRAYADSVAIEAIDVSQNPHLASRYKVVTVPTTVILDSQGKVKHLNYGVTPQAKLEAQLA